MRLLCPNCQQSITVPDAEASKMVACPLCKLMFPAPQLYSPPPEAPTDLAMAVPATPTPSTLIAPFAVPESPPITELTSPKTYTPHYANQYFVTLSGKVCSWIVPVSLTLALLLTFFQWDGFYPAGYAAYTQNAWQAMAGDVNIDPVAEKVWGKEKELNEGIRASWWLVPYVIFLVVGIVIAWEEPVRKRFNFKFPGAVERALYIRPTALAACAGATLFLLLIQSTIGFGLENVDRGKVQERFREEWRQAGEPDPPKTPEEIQRFNMKMAVEEAKFRVRQTVAVRMAIMFHFLAMAGIVGEMLIIHRGTKPHPRIGVMW